MTETTETLRANLVHEQAILRTLLQSGASSDRVCAQTARIRDLKTALSA